MADPNGTQQPQLQQQQHHAQPQQQQPSTQPAAQRTPNHDLKSTIPSQPQQTPQSTIPGNPSHDKNTTIQQHQQPQQQIQHQHKQLQQQQTQQQSQQQTQKQMTPPPQSKETLSLDLKAINQQKPQQSTQLAVKATSSHDSATIKLPQTQPQKSPHLAAQESSSHDSTKASQQQPQQSAHTTPQASSSHDISPMKQQQPQNQPPTTASTPAAKKRKPRSASNDSTPTPATPATATLAASSPKRSRRKKTDPPKTNETKNTALVAKPATTPVTSAITAPAASPPKRSRKKKTDQPKANDANNNKQPMAPAISTHPMGLPGNPNVPLLSMTGGLGLSMPPNSLLNTAPNLNQQPMPHMLNPLSNRQVPSLSPLSVQHQTSSQDLANRYYTMPPQSDYTNSASLTRPSLSRLFTSSFSSSASQEIAKAFEELRDNTWSHLSKCILEQAQQFDIPSLIGTLYTLRTENEKLTNKVRDLTVKREHLLAINARLDLPGPMLTQHLSHTSANFSSLVAGITNSPKSLSNSSPSPAMNKSPLVSGSSYSNHIGPLPPPVSSLGGASSYLRTSTISTPSPPIGVSYYPKQ